MHSYENAKYNINITCTRYVHGSSIKYHTQIVVPQVRCAKSTIPRTMSDITCTSPRSPVICVYFSRSTIYTKYQYVCVCVFVCVFCGGGGGGGWMVWLSRVHRHVGNKFGKQNYSIISFILIHSFIGQLSYKREISIGISHENACKPMQYHFKHGIHLLV